MKIALTVAALLALTSSSLVAQDCTQPAARAQAGTLASPAPPCKTKTEAKPKAPQAQDNARRDGFSGFYVGGSIGATRSADRP